MKKSQVAALLGLIAIVDRRTVGETDVEMWAELLPDEMTFEDARAAMIEHRRHSTEWLQPAHIVTLTEMVYRDRLRRAGDPPIPAGLSLTQEKRWRAAWVLAVKSGDPEPVGSAFAAIGMALARDRYAETVAGCPPELRAALLAERGFPAPTLAFGLPEQRGSREDHPQD